MEYSDKIMGRFAKIRYMTQPSADAIKTTGGIRHNWKANNRNGHDSNLVCLPKRKLIEVQACLNDNEGSI